MRDRIIQCVLRFPLLMLAIAIAGFVASALMLVEPDGFRPKLSIDSSLTGLLPARGAALETYQEVRRKFGGDDVLLVAWFSDHRFTRDELNALRRFTRKVQREDGVVRVDGIATGLNVQSSDGDVHIDRFLKRVPRTEAQVEQLLDQVIANPLYGGQFLSADGTATLLAVHFDESLGPGALRDVVDRIAERSAEMAGDLDQFVSGPVHARLEISRILFRDVQAALPLAVAITAFIAALSLRNIRGVLLPLLTTALGLGLTLGVFVVTGNALNFVTAIIPTVVFVIGFAFAMHVVSEFDRHFRSDTDKVVVVQEVLSEVFLPLSLTALTTAVGFASLLSSPIASIQLFGGFAALGTMLCWAGALFLIPAILLLAPVKAVGAGGPGWLANLAPPLAQFALRNRNAVLYTGAAVTLLAVMAASRLEISTDYLSNFPADAETVTNFDQIRTEFSGAVPLQVVLRSEIPDAFSDPVHLANLKVFESWLEQQPEVGAATTLVDFVTILHRAFEGADSGTNSLPQTRGELEDLFFLTGGDELERFVDQRFQVTVMHLQTSAVSTNDLVGLIGRIEAELTQLPPYFSGEVTGSSALLARTLDDIVRGQVTSLLGALSVIYLILYLLFGSARTAALALIPNVLPIACFFGLLAVSGITLNLATSLVAAVVLGIAVDDTMHFLSRFNAEARRVADETEGVARALAAVIRPVTFTTAALCCGFLTLTLGELRSQIEFGVFAAVTLLIAWVIDLTFTPALAGKLRFVTLWEVLTVDLGEAPHETIPFFAGLSNRQARIAAILGTMKPYEKGTTIFEQGEEGHNISIVIEGHARAVRRGDEVDMSLRRLERGDLIGEVVLFRGGERTADVIAETDVRMLQFSDECLRRIEHRYPRIGARLYQNLGLILADRLADLTDRLSPINPSPGK